jgi:streptolysin S family bacteriocin protoxin
MTLKSLARVEDKFSSVNPTVAPGGWCCSNCCWCWYATPGPAGEGADDEEL